MPAHKRLKLCTPINSEWSFFVVILKFVFLLTVYVSGSCTDISLFVGLDFDVLSAAHGHSGTVSVSLGHSGTVFVILSHSGTVFVSLGHSGTVVCQFGSHLNGSCNRSLALLAG